MAVNQLAGEYTGQPVLFLEYDVDNFELERKDYFWSAHSGDGSILLPLIILDSGRQSSSGPIAHSNVYKQMVDSALARAAAGRLEAAWWRVGDRVVTTVQLTNLSDVTLGAENGAAVHAVIYENARVKLTDRYVRADVRQEIGDGFLGLQPNATGTYTLISEELSGVDWEHLEVVVIADYRPGNESGAFDALQAGPATRLDSPFTVAATHLTLLSDPAGERLGASTRQAVQVSGAPGLTWTASVDLPWLTVTPVTGSVNTQAVVAVEPALLAGGWQQGTITFRAGNQYSQTLAVSVYHGDIRTLFLPLASKK